MRIDILTLFPELTEMYCNLSIIGRAIRGKKLEIYSHNFRDYTLNRQRQVDDAPYGGGQGMVLNAQPIYDCYMSVSNLCNTKPHLIYMSAKGKTLTQERVKELAKLSNIAILCGHYEGVDQRLIDEIVDEEISVGDYVVTGGELPALILTDAIARMIDGVLSDKEAYEKESHYDILLEHPQYTRPEVWQERRVPEVLLSGHHKNIETWKKEQSLELTKMKRYDLYLKYLKSIEAKD